MSTCLSLLNNEALERNKTSSGWKHSSPQLSWQTRNSVTVIEKLISNQKHESNHLATINWLGFHRPVLFVKSKCKHSFASAPWIPMFGLEWKGKAELQRPLLQKCTLGWLCRPQGFKEMLLHYMIMASLKYHWICSPTMNHYEIIVDFPAIPFYRPHLNRKGHCVWPILILLKYQVSNLFSLRLLSHFESVRFIMLK